MLAVAPLRQRLPSAFTCARCRRMLSTSAPLTSGHNKWSKIKHQKGAADNKRMVERSELSHRLITAVKLYGPDPTFNSQLANLIAIAKKSGMPKATIEAAVAKGQGRSASGAALEPLVLEIVMPPNVALIVEAEVERKIHEMQYFGQLIKKHGGTLSSTQYLFTRAGRAVFERPQGEHAVADDTIMDAAIEKGAEDVVFSDEEGDSEVVISTEPASMTGLVDGLGKELGLKATSVDLVWAPNEFTRANVGDAHQYGELVSLVEVLKMHPDVRAVYSNAEQGEMDDERWARLAANLDVV